MPPLEKLSAKLHALTLDLAQYGIFNFLLSNGEFMAAHCSTRLASIIRKAPFKEAHLKDQDVKIDFSEVTTQNDRVAVIATNPLTENESWVVHDPGTLLMFSEGEIVNTFKTIPGPTGPCASD